MKNYLTTLYDHLPEAAPDPTPKLTPFTAPTTVKPGTFNYGGTQPMPQRTGWGVTPVDFSQFQNRRGNPFEMNQLVPRDAPPGSHDPTPSPNDHPNRGNNPQKQDTPASTDVRPIARGRWNPDAANFGDLQKYWDIGAQLWGDGFKQEMAGYPQSAVKDLLWVMQQNEQSMTTTGKPAMLTVDGQQMTADGAIKYLTDKMRQVAQQLDTNYRQARGIKDQNDQNAADAIAKTPLMPRISPVIFK